MATEIATAYVQIVPSMQGVGKAISAAFGTASQTAGSQSGTNAGSAFTSGLSAKIGAIAGATSAIVTKAGSMIASGLTGAISRADQMNNFPKVMKNLGYSSEDAAASIKKITKSLDGLPTASSTMTGMVQQLAPLTSNLDDATDIALAFNNAMLAGGASTQEQANALTQYSQMLAAGKVDSQAWLSVTNAMPGQLNQIAQALLGAGKSSQDLYSAMQDGTISFDDFNKAVKDLNENGFGQYASFADQAKAATGGIGTAMENASNRVQKAWQKVIEAIGTDSIANAINGVTSKFGAVGDAAANMVTAVKNWLANLWKDLQNNGALQTFKEAWNSLQRTLSSIVGKAIDWSGMLPSGDAAGIIKSVADWFKALVDALPKVAPALAAAAAGFAGLKAATAITGTISSFSGTMTTLGKACAIVSKGLFSGQGAFTALGTGLSGLTGPLGAIGRLLASNPFALLIAGIAAAVAAVVFFLTQTQAGQQVLTQIMPILQSIGTQLMSVVQAVWPTLQMLMQSLQSILAPALQLIGSLLQAVLVPALTLLAAGLQAVMPIFTTVVTAVMNVVQAVLPGLTAAIQGVISILQGVIDFVVGVFTGNWSQAWNGIKTVFSGIWQAISGVFSAIWNGIKAAFSAGLNFISTLWSSIWNSVKAVVSTIFNAVVNVVSNAVSSIVSFISSLPGKIMGFFANAGSWLLNAGKAVLEGLLSGLKAAWDAVTGFIGGIGDWIVKHKGPLSYDKRMLIPAGQAIMQGLKNGLVDGFQPVRDTVNQISDELASTTLSSPSIDPFEHSTGYSAALLGSSASKLSAADALGTSYTWNVTINEQEANADPQMRKALAAFSEAMGLTIKNRT